MHLTKSKYIAGRQCERRLWLTCHAPDLPTPAPQTAQAWFDLGAVVGSRARDLFAGGVLVSEAPWEHSQAVERTRRLMQDATVGAVFEAAFEHEGVRVRVDVLERQAEGRWGMCEVKSSTRVKDVHLEDVAVQRFVVSGAGVQLGSVEVMVINNQYVRGDDGIESARLFVRTDVTAETSARQPEIPGHLQRFAEVLSQRAAPLVEPSEHCSSPYGCEFWAHCTAAKPADWIFNMPRLGGRQRDTLRRGGIERIRDIPDSFPLHSVQQRVRAAWRAGALQIDAGLATALATLGPPADYLDFETAAPAIPLYPGTRPYQQVPFQWSLHRLRGDGAIEHLEFLAQGAADPRAAFAESLILALREPNGPVLVWSGFEKRILRELAHLLPQHASALRALQARIVDLLPVTRNHVYHPDFGGGFSIKGVAPALVPGLSYDDLDRVADGGAAADALGQLASGAISSAEEVERLRRALLAYCERDTLAMLEVHRALRELA